MADDLELARDARAMQPAPRGDRMRVLQEAGTDMLRLEELISQTEGRLKALKAQHLALTQRTIPDLMDEAGTDKVGLPGVGSDLTVVPFYKAVLPEENAAEAAEWLDREGHGSLLRTYVTVEFSPGEREHAENVITLIKSYFRGRNIEQHDPTVKNTVHWKTLTAFVKEQIEENRVVPLELLGATVGRVAKIKQRKEK